MYACWLAYWVALFAVMHASKPPGAKLVVYLTDWLLHAGAYFVLAGLGGWAALRRGRRLNARWILTWLVIYAAYAAADELLQPLTGRYCQFTDWLADVIGAALALLMVARLARSQTATR